MIKSQNEFFSSLRLQRLSFVKKVAFITEIAFLATVISACGGDSASNPETLTALSDESKPVEMSSSVREELSGDLSSSGRTQSSASIGSSSSSAVAIGIDPSTVVAGILTDSRDGQTYRTVKIGEQVWMAENMNYKVEDSYCYNDEDGNCDKYGRLYTWKAAVAACPSGWHLPTSYEYWMLIDAAGRERVAVKTLMSTNGWQGDVNGSNVYTFTMLPGGVNFSGHDYQGEGEIATFWSIGAPSPTEYIEHIRAVEAGYDDLIFIGAEDFFFVADGDVITGLLVEEDGASVRCVEGELMDYIKFSSSSKEISSSSNDSNESSSSSSAVAITSSAVLSVVDPSTVVVDSLIDSRDGRTYRTVKIDDQVWMAENLNYKTSDSYCLNGSSIVGSGVNCSSYDRLYFWTAADTACPYGWHLPTKAEFETLLNSVGGIDVAGRMLKSEHGWYHLDDIYGIDEYGFTALPVGYCENPDLQGMMHRGEMSSANFWTSTEVKQPDLVGASHYRYYLQFLSNRNSASFGRNLMHGTGYSVRCVKD